MDSQDVSRAAREVGDHPVVENGARVGYAVNGLVHLLIGWIALQLALGRGGGETADQSGALQTLARSTLGQVSLWLGVAGFALLGLWQLTEAILRRSDTGDRVKAAGKTVVYAALAWSCLAVLRGSGSSSREQTTDITANLMSRPAGQVLVVVLGLAIIGIGGYHVVKGAKKKFLQDLRRHPGQWAERAGRVGYIAKGIALAVVGGMFVLAGLRANAAEATGLDGALHNLLGFPYGQALLVAIALGFAGYAVYSFARARYAAV